MPTTLQSFAVVSEFK